ncbi:TlpA family protein disulfide reductase [Aurantiacibacter suaedae]|uniref:TlpA family protein disulfide reductase n=1 Tax=Aurantiacibacter suaedae TaxID=2545755 RepID=UPI0010F6DAA3|nr:TlpA disulfide reductase family protein [Aurantiacibacter suaedae]
MALEELSLVKLRKSPKLLVVCLAALLAGCDTGAEPDTQAASTEAQDGTLTGTLDRSLAGEEVPEVTVRQPDGTELALAEMDGQPFLLNLWATWCAPCVVEMPLLDDMADELGDTVRVVTVSEDLRGAEAVEPFFADHDFVALEPWMDPDNALAFAYGGGAVLPLTILYDAEGKEVWRVIGAYDWSTPEAHEAVLEAAVSTKAE